MGILLLILLIILLFGGWSYRDSYGYAAPGLVTVLIIVLLVVLIVGRGPVVWW